MTSIDKIRFPCQCVPKDGVTLKLLGVYPQRQSGLFMQRIKLLGGNISSHQWRGLGRLASSYTPGTGLFLTTRQDIEFHNVSEDHLPQLQQDLAQIGCTGQGAGGDTLRNITICPGNGLCSGTFDVRSIAQALQSKLETFPGIYNLPRKFKISFSACTHACGKPWIHDLSFIALPGTQPLMFRVIGAGSLGPHPATGIELCAELPAEQVPNYAYAVMSFFYVHGDRSTRSRARLRHMRERLGTEHFLKLLDVSFADLPTALQHYDSVYVMTEAQYHSVTELSPPYGEITPEQAGAIAKLIEQTRCITRIDTCHRIVIYAQDVQRTIATLSADHLLSSLVKQPDIASCPGTAYCRHACVDTHTAEAILRTSFGGQTTSVIRISGCPHGCTHSAVAPIGLVGRLRQSTDRRPIQGFQVLQGGGMGITPNLAQCVADFIPIDQLSVYMQNFVNRK